ncbi:MAG: excinuclease ABC subunit UvrC [Candidatus Sumerlaeia bacterium]|nr:excinuclease ABC subunit UvrC [Candidatus Sumerlaeia bacterium]
MVQTSAPSHREKLLARAHEFPAAPGVYLMKDAAGEVLYVGKAFNLRARVSSYFGATPDERPQTEFLVRRVAALDYIVTATDKEAFLLENALIKKHRPRYNIRLRDDKTYLSLRIDPREQWPRLQMVRKRADDGALYFGPYTSSQALRETFRTLLRIFPLCSCREKIRRNRTRPCLMYEIGMCCCPYYRAVDPAYYAQLVQDAILFLRGQRTEVVERLTQRMQEKSDRMEFEEAARIRDQVAAINLTIERQRIAVGPGINRDVIAAVAEKGRWLALALIYRGGVVSDRREFDLPDIGQSEGDILRGVISQLYAIPESIPDEIHLSSEPDDRETIEQWLAEVRGRAVRLHVPQRGEGRSLMDLALQNARQRLRDRIESGRNIEAALSELSARLRLPAPPEHIECFDISNIQGTLAVGAMVQFVGGLPNRSGYRLFKIRTVEGANDFGMMHEVLSRRYRRLIETGRPLPDLILVDGGKGQLNAAAEAMKALGAPTAVLRAIAKSRLEEQSKLSADEDGTAGPASEIRHTDERLFIPGQKNPVTFPAGSPALLLLQHIRNEAHRFAITYHKKLRRSRSLRSLLQELPGVGEARKRALLRAFGSIEQLRKASVEEIARVPGIPIALARDLHRFLAESDG